MIDFIIPTYDRIDALRSMLSSLIVQTSNEWRATVIVDGKNDEVGKLIDSLNHPNIRKISTLERYNDWGHTPREIGKQQSDCDYIIMTGDDNYYIPTTVKEITRTIRMYHPDIIYWDMIHSHYGYSYFKCELRTHRIDMGSFCTISSIAKQIKLGTNFAADGDFIETFRKRFPDAKKYKINKVLFVHN